MKCESPKPITKDLVNVHEVKSELGKLSKLHIIATTGRYSDLKVYASIRKPDVVEVRIYYLTNDDLYWKFRRGVKKLELR